MGKSQAPTNYAHHHNHPYQHMIIPAISRLRIRPTFMHTGLERIPVRNRRGKEAGRLINRHMNTKTLQIMRMFSQATHMDLSCEQKETQTQTQ